MSRQEELFKEFQLLGKSFQNLGSIVQTNNTIVSYEELEEYDRNLDILLSRMQQMRMKVFLHLKDEGAIK